LEQHLKKNLIATLLGFGALLGAASPAMSQTVVNGSFEQGTTGADGGSCATGWTCTGNVNEQNWNYFNTQFGATAHLTASPNGGNVADAWYVSSSVPADSLSQTLESLTIGKTYTVTFEEAITNRSATFYNGTMDWLVSIGGATLSSQAIGIPGPSESTLWTTVTASFVADAASETLKFLAQTSVATAPEPVLLLDGVAVTAAVPEPSSYALLLAGVGVMFFVVKRRKAV
jgi:hypothetical protein